MRSRHVAGSNLGIVAALVYLLGDTRDEFGGSEWAHVVHGYLGGRPPVVDLAREQLLADILINASRNDLVDSAHDLAEGGLAQALVESCLRRDAGVRIVLPEGLDPFVALFSESTGRAIVSVARSQEIRFTEMCTAGGLPIVRIGVVDLLTPTFQVQDQFSLPLRELRAAWTATIAQQFG